MRGGFGCKRGLGVREGFEGQGCGGERGGGRGSEGVGGEELDEAGGTGSRSRS